MYASVPHRLGDGRYVVGRRSHKPKSHSFADGIASSPPPPQETRTFFGLTSPCAYPTACTTRSALTTSRNSRARVVNDGGAAALEQYACRLTPALANSSAYVGRPPSDDAYSLGKPTRIVASNDSSTALPTRADATDAKRS